MSAAADIRLPGRGFVPTVARASERELDECERADLAAIKNIVEPKGMVPTNDRPPEDIKLGDDGLPTDLDAVVAWERQRSRPGEANVLLSTSRRVIAIRAERAERLEKAKRDREAARARSRERIEANLADAPMIAARFQSAADRFNAAVDVYQEVVEAFAVVLGSANIAKAYESFVADVQSAAQALGVDAPELPEIEFSKHDARALYAVRGMRSGNRPEPLVDLVPKTPHQSVVASDIEKVRA